MRSAFLMLCCTLLVFAAETKEIRKEIPVSNARIAVLRGFMASSVEISTWEKNEVAVRLSVDFSQSDKQREKEQLALIDVVAEQSGDSVFLRFRGPSKPEGWSAFIDAVTSLFSASYMHMTVKGEIILPASMHLVSDMRYGVYSVDGVNGNVIIAGVANTLTVTNSPSVRVIENNYGTTTIDRSGGELKLTGESSRIAVNTFRGSIAAATHFSTVTMEAVSGNVSVECQNGTVDINGVGGMLTLDSDFSTVTAEQVKGAVVVTSQSATIRVKQAGGAVVTAPYSNITVEQITGTGEPVVIHNTVGSVTLSDISRDVSIEDTYSQLNLSGIRGHVALKGSGSTLRGRKITGDLFVHNEHGAVRVTELSATTVDIRNKYSAVEIHLLVKPSVITITNEHAPVTVSFPEFSGEVGLDASFGSIKTNLPLGINTTPDGATATGKIGSGKGNISISTISERIDLMIKK